MPQHSEIALPDIAYNRTDYTALRAYCSGVEVRIIADRYYSDDSPELEQGLERFLKRMRNHLVDRALESHPAHPDILRNARDKRQITSSQLDFLIKAANVPRPVPARTYRISQWFRPSMTTLLGAKGIHTIGDLVERIEQRGAGWWRALPRVGPGRARYRGLAAALASAARRDRSRALAGDAAARPGDAPGARPALADRDRAARHLPAAAVSYGRRRHQPRAGVLLHRGTQRPGGDRHLLGPLRRQAGNTPLIARLNTALERGVEEGSLAIDGSPKQVVESLYQLWLGASVMVKIVRGTEPFDSAMAVTRQMLRLAHSTPHSATH